MPGNPFLQIPGSVRLGFFLFHGDVDIEPDSFSRIEVIVIELEVRTLNMIVV